MNGLHRTQCWHIVGLQHHVVRGPQVAETCRMPTTAVVRAVPTTPASWEVRGAGRSSPPGSCGRVGCRRGGRGRERRAPLHCSHLRHGLGRGRARFQAPGVRSTPGGGRRRGRRRGRRGSGPSGRAGEQGVKRGRRQRACQTRACAVCTASVLWVSAAAAAAAGGSVRPGQRRLQPPEPRAAAPGADTQCGTRRGAGGPAAWGRHGRQPDAGGSRSSGRGGGEQAAQESAPSPGAGGGAGASRETALLAAPAPGRRPALPCPCPQPRPAPHR